MQALILAKAALQPLYLNLGNFNFNIKHFNTYVRLHTWRTVSCGGTITTSHWINLHAALSTCDTEHFRLPVLQWKWSWQTKSGEVHDWSLLQFLAMLDGEFLRLEKLGQWKPTDANTTNIALQAAMAKQAAQFKAHAQAFTAYKAAVQSRHATEATTATTHQKPSFPRIQGRKKPNYKPGIGQSLERTIDSLHNLWCSLCKHWTLTHTTPFHARRVNHGNNTNHAEDWTVLQANLAYGTGYEQEQLAYRDAPEFVDF